MPISPEDVVKVITDPRFVGLWEDLRGQWQVRIRRDSGTFSTRLRALAWAKGMFDQWDANRCSQREDTHDR